MVISVIFDCCYGSRHTTTDAPERLADSADHYCSGVFVYSFTKAISGNISNSLNMFSDGLLGNISDHLVIRKARSYCFRLFGNFKDLLW